MLVTELWDSGSFYSKGFCTPFRLILTGADLNSFYNNDLVKNTARERDSVFDKTGDSWIKPGKAAWSYFVDREISCEYDTIMSFIDSAAQISVKNIIIDNGWRRWALTEPGAFLKVKKVCDKAHAAGIDVWVWKSSRLGPYSSLYRKYFFTMCKLCGVSGVKLDHLECESRKGINLYTDFASDAAKHKLLISYHNPNKPTGLSRTFPNLLTREAVRGLQTYSCPKDNVTHAFTRFIPDCADYTPFCFSVPRLQRDSTIAHMLATTVIFNSGMLTFAEHPRNIFKQVIAPFLNAVAPVWDQTVVLKGSKIGTLALFARRSGANWFVAALNGTDEYKNISVALAEFLTDDTIYEALSYCDVQGDKNNIHRSKFNCSKNDTVTALLAPGGGYAAYLVPQDDEGRRKS